MPVPRRLLLVLLIANGVLLPCGCLPILPLVNAFNPMQIAFVTEIFVTNATDKPIRVTPIGARGPVGSRHPLPMFRSALPAFDSAQRGGFLAAPGSTITLLYDWDDHNLTEIVVEDQAGRFGQLVTDLDPTSTSYRRPNPFTFTITDFSQLQPVPANVLAAHEQAQQPFRLWPRLLPFSVLWLTFGILLWAWRRKKREAGVTSLHSSTQSTNRVF